MIYRTIFGKFLKFKLLQIESSYTYPFKRNFRQEGNELRALVCIIFEPLEEGNDYQPFSFLSLDFAV